MGGAPILSVTKSQPRSALGDRQATTVEWSLSDSCYALGEQAVGPMPRSRHSEVGKEARVTKSRRSKTASAQTSPSEERRRSMESRLLQERDKPDRSPTWRWDLAGELSAPDHIAALASHDPMFSEVVGFRLEYSLPRDAADLEKLFRQYPDLFQACALYFRKGLPRCTLEARLLAGQTSVEISNTMGIDASVVDVYEATFFNVRDRLEDMDWILQYAIPCPFDRPGKSNPQTMIMLGAYFNWPGLMDALLTETGPGSADRRTGRGLTLDVKGSPVPEQRRDAVEVDRPEGD